MQAHRHRCRTAPVRNSDNLLTTTVTPGSLPRSSLGAASGSGNMQSPKQQPFQHRYHAFQSIDAGGKPPVLVIEGVERLVIEDHPGVEQLPGRQRGRRLSVRGGTHQRLAAMRATPP